MLEPESERIKCLSPLAHRGMKRFGRELIKWKAYGGPQRSIVLHEWRCVYIKLKDRVVNMK